MLLDGRVSLSAADISPFKLRTSEETLPPATRCVKLTRIFFLEPGSVRSGKEAIKEQTDN